MIAELRQTDLTLVSSVKAFNICVPHFPEGGKKQVILLKALGGSTAQSLADANTVCRNQDAS